MKSIQRRLSLGLISVMVIVGVVLAQTSLWLFETGLQRYLEAGLRNDAENLLVAMVRGPNGLQLDEQHVSPAYQRPFSGHYFRVDFADTHWRSRSPRDQELPRLPEVGIKGNLQLGPEGQQLLVLRSDYKRFGQLISISVAQDYTPVRESFRLMRQIGLVLGLAALLLVLVLQRVTVRRALRPWKPRVTRSPSCSRASARSSTPRCPWSWSRWWRRSITCWRILKTASSVHAMRWATSDTP